MKTAVILAAGEGTKIWPYSELRPKETLAVANKPIIAYNVDALKELGFESVLIAVGQNGDLTRNIFAQNEKVRVLTLPKLNGTAPALSYIAKNVTEEEFLVLYGDTILDICDLKRLASANLSSTCPAAALVAPIGREEHMDWICCNIADGVLTEVCGHPRAGYSHRFCAFAVSRTFLHFAETNPGVFRNVQTGIMAPTEAYIEMSLSDCIRAGYTVKVLETAGYFMDIDKPWHLLEASFSLVNKRCNALKQNEIPPSSAVDPSAFIAGKAVMGNHCRIGRNVIINGSVIMGDNSVIENGAVIDGNLIVGRNCHIANYCYIFGGSAIGNNCCVHHCAEFAGITMENIELSHYMQFYGVVGTASDLGAGTVCGDLRFDDRRTVHKIKGRRETPINHYNATYVGEYCRTGVNCMIMPGLKMGCYSIVGPGVILKNDLPSRTMISIKAQELLTKEWGPEKYGW